jgi:hypothetical protein
MTAWPRRSKSPHHEPRRWTRAAEEWRATGGLAQYPSRMTDEQARLPGWAKVSDLLGTVVASLDEVKAQRKLDVGQLEESLQKLRAAAGVMAKENAGKLAARVEERRAEVAHVDAALARIEEVYFALGQLEVDVRGRSGDAEEKAKQLAAFEELHKATVAGLSTQIAMFHDDLRAAKRRIQDLTAAHDVATADAARVAEEAAQLATKNEQERTRLQKALVDETARASAELTVALEKHEREREANEIERNKLRTALAEQSSVIAELRSVVDALTSSLPPEPAGMRAMPEMPEISEPASSPSAAPSPVPASADAPSTAAWPAPSEHGAPPPPPPLPPPPTPMVASPIPSMPPMPATATPAPMAAPLPPAPAASGMTSPSASGLQEIDFDIDDPSVSTLALPARIDLTMYVKPTSKLAQLKGGAREIKIAGILSHWDGADIQRIIDISKLPSDEVIDCVRFFVQQGFVTLEPARSEKSEPLPPSPSN